MPTRKRIATVLFALLGAFSLIIVDLRYLLLPTACVSLLLFVAGLIYFPRLRSAFTIPWPAIEPGEPVERIVIEDIACPRKEYDQELVVVLTTRRLTELIATVTLASATAALVITGRMSAPPFLMQGWGLLGLEFACLSAWAILLMNVHWFSERQFLRNAYWAFSLISTKGSGFPRREITYQFSGSP